MGGNSLELGIGVRVEKPADPTDGATNCANMDTIRLRWGSKSSWGVFLRITSGMRVRTVYHDLYLGGKTLVERENMGFDLTKSDLCPSFAKDLTAKGVGLRVADFLTCNHRKDGFTPLETIQMFLGVIGSRSLSSSKGRPSSQRGGLRVGGEGTSSDVMMWMIKVYKIPKNN
ncbi:hypothetical protein Tco_0872899 [Tanacetum coccineum]